MGAEEEATMNDLLLTNVRPLGEAASDILVQSGRIAEVGAGLRLAGGHGEVVDGGGQLAIPGLVDVHAHLDKTLWGLPWRPHTAGPGLAGLIENEPRPGGAGGAGDQRGRAGRQPAARLCGGRYLPHP
jgi:cytosine/creatinine deaminase